MTPEEREQHRTQAQRIAAQQGPVPRIWWILAALAWIGGLAVVGAFLWLLVSAALWVGRQ